MRSREEREGAQVTQVRNEPVAGYSVYSGGARSCVASVAQWIESGTGCRWLACLNPHSYVIAAERPDVEAALRAADWLVPDGIGIVLASRLQGGTLRERVTGADVFLGLHQTLNRRRGGRVFFIGSTEETLRRIQRRMAVEFPRLDVVGTYSPRFTPTYSEAEMDEMVRAINAARPDVLWVGMTAPKQELWTHTVRHRLDVKFAAAVGAVFDFYAGTVKRPHPLIQRVGLEWAPRLLREPRRLWRRTFVSAPVFVWHIIRNLLRAHARLR